MNKLIPIKSIEGFKIIKENQVIGTVVKTLRGDREKWVISPNAGEPSTHENLDQAKAIAVGL